VIAMLRVRSANPSLGYFVRGADPGARMYFTFYGARRGI
jgi:hypothetical protein